MRPTTEVAILRRLNMACDDFSKLCSRYFPIDLSAEAGVSAQASSSVVIASLKTPLAQLVVELEHNVCDYDAIMKRFVAS